MSVDHNESLDAEAWRVEQRGVVQAYLENQGVRHGEIGEWPAWHLHPYLAIWAIESLAFPGRVGWWVISGDVPTDYVSFKDADHPREVMRHFAKQWAEISACMLRGEPHPEISMGSPDQWPELGALLRRRAKLIRDYANDDEIWRDVGLE